MQLSNAEQETIRTRPQSTELYLSIFQPRTVMACQVGSLATGTVGRGDRIIPFDTVSSGAYTDVESGMTMLIGTTAGDRDIGKIRVRSASATEFIVSENSHIPWATGQFITIQRYWEVWPIYPRIIPDPANDEDVIFYKDYDIEYTDQNTKLGAFPCAGNHRALWKGESSYYSASGTVALVSGTSLSYSWEFEGGTPSTSASHTPGTVSYSTAGHYVTKLTVTGDNGAEDITYRYVSVYEKPANSANNNPIKNWTMRGLGGSRGEGGNRVMLSVTAENLSLHGGDVVVIFADDWYGATNTSLGGNSIGNAKIFFVGHIVSNSIKWDYRTSTAEFEVGNITEQMRATETFAISLETTKDEPAKWFQMKDLDGRKGIYHYLKWHSTVLNLADLEFRGQDALVQYFDTDKQSLFDAVDNYMRNALLGTMVSDRQGKLWVEVGAYMYDNPTGSFPPSMSIARRDWMGEPNIEERLNNEVSFVEVGGVAYSGETGTFQPFISNAPGSTPDGRGQPENIPGLALASQEQLNKISGNVYANSNSRYPTISLDLTSNFRNLDIAPLETVDINILAGDTVLNTAIHAPYLIDDIQWEYDVSKKLLVPNVTLQALVNGQDGETVTIPDIPEGGGFTEGGGGINPIFTPPTITGFGNQSIWKGYGTLDVSESLPTAPSWLDGVYFSYTKGGTFVGTETGTTSALGMFTSHGVYHLNFVFETFGAVSGQAEIYVQLDFVLGSPYQTRAYHIPAVINSSGLKAYTLSDYFEIQAGSALQLSGGGGAGVEVATFDLTVALAFEIT